MELITVGIVLVCCLFIEVSHCIDLLICGDQVFSPLDSVYVHFSKFIDSKQDISFIPLDQGDVRVNVSLDLLLSELPWLVLKYVIFLPLSLLSLVLFH